MDINRSNMEIFFEDLKVVYTDAFNSHKESAVLDSIAMIVPSTSAVTQHGWLNQIPRMREWVGDRNVNNIESDKLKITNRRYENTVEMPRDDIEDDNHGLYRNLATMIGMEAAIHPDKLVVDELTDGTTTNWVDDVAFFIGSRTYGANVIDNTVTGALSQSTLETAIDQMGSFLGHSDDPLGVMPFALLYGPSNRVNAFNLLKNDFAAQEANGGSATDRTQGQNPNKGIVIPVESKRLVGSQSSDWYLLGEIAGIRGLAYQQRVVAEFQASRLQLDSDFLFNTDKFQFGVRARGAAFLTLPHLIIKGNSSA